MIQPYPFYRAPPRVPEGYVFLCRAPLRLTTDGECLWLVKPAGQPPVRMTDSELWALNVAPSTE